MRYWTWLSFAVQYDEALLSFAVCCHAGHPCSFASGLEKDHPTRVDGEYPQ